MLASGARSAATELWEMARSCQRATSSRPATRGNRVAPGRPARTLGADRVCAYAGIADEPFWPVEKRLLHLTDLGRGGGGSGRQGFDRGAGEAHAYKLLAWRSRRR